MAAGAAPHAKDSSEALTAAICTKDTNLRRLSWLLTLYARRPLINFAARLVKGRITRVVTRLPEAA